MQLNCNSAYHSLINAPCVAEPIRSTDGSHLQMRNLGEVCVKTDEERCQIWVKDLQLESGEINVACEDFVQSEGWLSAVYMKCSLKGMQGYCQDICTFMAHEVDPLTYTFTQLRSVVPDLFWMMLPPGVLLDELKYHILSVKLHFPAF